MALWISIAALVLAIFVGWKFKFNTGVISMALAFIIGVLVLKLKVTDIINFWPTTIVFYLLSIALFFTYGTENGTMDILGKKLLYALGGNSKLIPFAIAVVCAIVGGLGAGASTPAIVGPFAFAMANSAGIHPVMTCMAIAFGNLIGSNNPYNGYGGVISYNLIVKNGVSADVAMNLSQKLWVNMTIIAVVIIVIFYFIYKAYKCQKVTVEKPPAFTSIQRTTFTIIIIAFILMVVPSILATWIKTSKFLTTMAAFCQPQVIMILGSVACAFLKLAPEKDVIRKIPISTIVMIVGVYMLIQVATKAGLINAVSNALTNSIPKFFVPAAIVLFAAFLSFFSSSTSTVMPLMYPLVPGLAASLGISPLVLYSCIFFGGLSTAVSPFSTGGALTIASCADNEVREGLPNKMIIAALISPAITIVWALLGLFGILG
jgi:Di- and tricarboxylate transporters